MTQSRRKKSMRHIREFTEVLALTKQSPRSKNQLNHLFEADCEIIKWDQFYFCFSTDSIGEEISIELYEDPYLWGWMTVMSSVSDLAVTGAEPLGLLLSTQWKFHTEQSTTRRFYQGVNAALKAAKVDLLGGDSGYAGDHVMTSSIFGVASKKPLMRMGAMPGDYVLVTEPQKTGVGPCVAYRYLLKQPMESFPEKLFRPTPQIEMIKNLRPYIHASIDTSDGLASCLYIVAQLNNIGYDLNWNSALIHPKALKFCNSHKIHPLMLWMGDHGDFQSLIFVPKKNLQKILRRYPKMVVLGQCTDRSSVYTVEYQGKKIPLPFEQVTECERDAEAIHRLVEETNSFFWNRLR